MLEYKVADNKELTKVFFREMGFFSPEIRMATFFQINLEFENQI